MKYSYKEALKIYGSRYKIQKAINQGTLFKHTRNVYSNDENTNELDIITVKYPYAIFTLNSAYYFHDLTDVIPRYNYIAIEEHTKINKKEGFVLTYMRKDLHELGITTLETHNAVIRVYDLEKLLIELVRNRNSFGYDYYKEIINNYREISKELDIQKLSEYLDFYKNRDNILIKIQNEVF